MRSEITVDGIPISFLSAGEGPLVLLLHGTYWSRVWAPVMPAIAKHGVRAVAVDFPGAGRSGGRLTLETATVPALATWVERFADALGAGDELLVAGHDIGGAVTQHLAAHGRRTVPRFALVNSVTYDSWPVDGVKRFRDPEVAAAVTVEELLEWRRRALYVAFGRMSEEREQADYLSPWRDPEKAQSWLALAGAADSKYTRAARAVARAQAPRLGRGRPVPAHHLRRALRGERAQHGAHPHPERRPHPDGERPPGGRRRPRPLLQRPISVLTSSSSGKNVRSSAARRNPTPLDPPVPRL